ncbi:MAG: hypothetical protein SVK08_00110 [Halobacteriota archaeon]|nr:hypothetical protein [Halobacteriota archaeon]
MILVTGTLEDVEVAMERINLYGHYGKSPYQVVQTSKGIVLVDVRNKHIEDQIEEHLLNAGMSVTVN